MAGRPKRIRSIQSYVNHIDAHTAAGPMKMGTAPRVGVTRNFWHNYQAVCHQSGDSVKQSYRNVVALGINPARTPVGTCFNVDRGCAEEYVPNMFPSGSGSTGPVEFGPTGPTGPTGNGGLDPTGANGVAGPTGEDGIVGPTGEDGGLGSTGADGVMGPTGEQGATGPQGNTGPTGAGGVVGPTGEQGPIGEQGNTGPTGIDGIGGSTGPTGPQGDIGPTGVQGVVGIGGSTGPTGSQGNIGPTGMQGNTGPGGIQGNTGPTGNDGSQGNTGPTGVQGPQGTAGIIGPTGSQGITGPTGMPSTSLVGTAYGVYLRWITSPAGWDVSSTNRIFIGNLLPSSVVTTYAVSIGSAGSGTSAPLGVSIGVGAASKPSIGTGIVAIGTNNGSTNTSVQSICIGNNSMLSYDCGRSVVIGTNAAVANSFNNSGNLVVIGSNAGSGTPGCISYCVVIGANAGQNANSSSIAIGLNSGNAMSSLSVAIGVNAGGAMVGTQAIAIGYNAALTGANANSIVIGVSSAMTNVGSNSIVIGANVGTTTNIAQNAIVLSVTGISPTTRGLYIDALQFGTWTTPATVLSYNTTTKEIQSTSTTSLTTTTSTRTLTGITVGSYQSDPTPITVPVSNRPWLVSFTVETNYNAAGTNQHWCAIACRLYDGTNFIYPTIIDTSASSENMLTTFSNPPYSTTADSNILSCFSWLDQFDLSGNANTSFTVQWLVINDLSTSVDLKYVLKFRTATT